MDKVKKVDRKSKAKSLPLARVLTPVFLLAMHLTMQPVQGYAALPFNKMEADTSQNNRRSLARKSSLLKTPYTYLDVDYDDKQNDLLAIQALQDQFNQDMNKLQDAYFKPLAAVQPAELLHALQAKSKQNKDALELALTQASADHTSQAKALEDYYLRLTDLLGQDELPQAWQRYRAFRQQYDALILVYSQKAGDNRYAHTFSEHFDGKHLNPRTQACKVLFGQMEALGALIESLKLELKHKTRERQILHNDYSGLSGSVQRVSDYLQSKGAFARR